MTTKLTPEQQAKVNKRMAESLLTVRNAYKKKGIMFKTPFNDCRTTTAFQKDLIGKHIAYMHELEKRNLTHFDRMISRYAPPVAIGEGGRDG